MNGFEIILNIWNIVLGGFLLLCLIPWGLCVLLEKINVGLNKLGKAQQRLILAIKKNKKKRCKMGFSGGVFTKTYNWEQDAANSIGITPVRHEAQDQEFVSGFNLCLL